MDYIVTTCCKDKKMTPTLLPAIERYLDPRIKKIALKAVIQNSPFLIFSGKFGLIEEDHPIPWYDYPLQSRDIDSLLPLLKKQIETLEISSLTAYLLPENTPGWAPYHHVFQHLSELIPVKIITL